MFFPSPSSCFSFDCTEILPVCEWWIEPVVRVAFVSTGVLVMSVVVSVARHMNEEGVKDAGNVWVGAMSVQVLPWSVLYA